MLVKKKQDTYVYQEDNQYFITLSDKTWDRIIYKVNNIKIKKHFDLSSYIIGAIIPISINIVCDYFDKLKTVDYFPFFICGVLYIISKALERFCPFFSSDNTKVNISHLEELKTILEQADIRKQNTTTQDDNDIA